MLIVAKNVKFLSSPMALGQFTAENATPNEDHHADIKPRAKISHLSNFCFLLVVKVEFLMAPSARTLSCLFEAVACYAFSGQTVNRQKAV